MFETTNQITFIHVAHHAACDAQVMRRSYLVIYLVMLIIEWLVRPPMFVGSVGEACCGKECDSNHQFQ